MLKDPLFLVSVNLLAAVMMRCVKPNLFSALVLAVVMIASTTYMVTQHAGDVMFAIYQTRDQVLTIVGKPTTWPPEKHRVYPDLELVDQEGKRTRLSEFKGKVILLEPVGMSCPGCIAFSGGHRYGPFQGAQSQPGLSSIDEYARTYGNVKLDHPDIVFVQLLLFNRDMQAPSPEEVTAWAKHFAKRRSKNQIVLGGTPSLATSESQALVPGFQLIDRNFVLRMDSTGEQPVDNLYSKLLPMIRVLIDE